MVDSRLKQNPSSIFLCYLHISAPKDKTGAKIEKVFPELFDDQEEIFKRVPEFSYPYLVETDGVQYSTFVLTDIDSKFRYGFCRYAPQLSHCLCIISYLPWFETFYSVLDKLSEFKEEMFRNKFLDLMIHQAVPKPGSKLKFRFTSSTKEVSYIFQIPDTTKLPSIPDNRNLTEYFAKVDPENMIHLFISMLFERRIIVTSKKLSVLTAVIHGSVSLLYPMQWQHIYVPILPPSLLPYCCAPMPFLVGIHTSMMEEVRMMPLDEVVIFNADTKEIEISGKDIKHFPSQIYSRLKRKLSRIDRAFQNDYVSSQFLKALADLIGGYRDALIYTETKEGSRVIFDENMFLVTRTGELKDFLSDILALQSFQQFIHGRLDLLNDGVGFVDVFEQAVNDRNVDSASEAKYKQWMDKARYEMKKGGGVFKKTVEEKYGHLKGIDVKDVKNKIKKKVKDGYKGVAKYAHSKEEPPQEKEITIKRNNSVPAKKKLNSMYYKDRRSMIGKVKVPTRPPARPPTRPPPRPPRPPLPAKLQVHNKTSEQTASVELPRKNHTTAATHSSATYSESQSEPNIAGLMDSSNSSLNDSHSSLGNMTQTSTSSQFSDTDSSPEHVGCFSNPGFLDPHDDKFYVISTEDHVLEHTPLSSNNNEERASSPYSFHRTASSLKRTNHVKSDKPNIPIRANSTKPERPPQLESCSVENEKLLKKTSELNKDLIFEKEGNTFGDDFVTAMPKEVVVMKQGRNSPIVLPTSPFYSPNSEDLLGLDSSLFQETMLSLSEDTRSLMSKNQSQTGSFRSENNSGINESSRNSSFENISNTEVNLLDKQFNDTSGYQNLSNNDTKLTPLDKAAAKTFTVDPFATFYEEAKKDLKSQTKIR